MVSIPGSIGKVEGLFEYTVELQNEFKLVQADPESSQKKRKIDLSVGIDRSSDDGQVKFPVSVPRVDKLTLEELVNKLEKLDNQNLLIDWNYVKVSDTIVASMRVYSQGEHHFLLENECVAMSDHFQENATEKFEDNIQLFVAIVFAAHNALLSVSNVKLKPSRDDRSLNLQLDLNLDVEKAKVNNAVPLISALSRIVQSKKIVIDGRPSKKSKLSVTNGTAPSTSSSISLITPPTSSKNTPTSLGMTSPPFDSYFSFSTPPIPADTSLESFFSNLQPPVSDEYREQYVSDKMAAKLTPFQTQNVEWMVNREGHVATKDGRIVKNPQLNQALPLLYSGVHESETTGRYINLFTDVSTTNRAEMDELANRSFKGGILADEMGLGKTVR
jgi:hypothetical protein